MYARNFKFMVLIVSLMICFVTYSNAQENNEDQEEKKSKSKGEKVEVITVTATRIETSTKEVANSVTVITSEEIKKKQKTTVLELLRNTPSLDVIQSGGPGTNTLIYIRGAKSEHTLVLVDGVEMNDPVKPGRSYDFSDLSTENIERIEILRGPQSTLYGSDAIGGVINIITKKGKGKPTGKLTIEAGSYKTFREALSVRGGNKWVNFSAGLERFDTDGISAANEKDGNHEEDQYERTSFSTRLGFTPTEIFEIDFILRYIDSLANIDNNGGVGGDDPNNTIDSEQFMFRSQSRISLFEDMWEIQLGLSLTRHDRHLSNGYDYDHPDEMSEGDYLGRLMKIDLQNNFYILKSNIITLGFEYEQEDGESDYYSESSYGPYTSVFENKRARNTGIFLQDQINIDEVFFATLGLRYDDHSRFGDETTFRIAAAYIFEKTNTKIKATYGTGFKAPSLFQLYSDYGDVNLNSEKSDGWDFGFEQYLLDDKLIMGATYFNNDYEELIDFDSDASLYQNISEADSEGVELFADIRPIDDLDFRLSYTYNDTENKDTGDPLLRRARNKFRFDANYRFLEKGSLHLDIIYVGSKHQKDFSSYPSTIVKLDGYTVVNLGVSYDINEHFRVLGKVNNLFDEDYEEVMGYGTPGISAYFGVELSF